MAGTGLQIKKKMLRPAKFSVFLEYGGVSERKKGDSEP